MAIYYLKEFPKFAHVWVPESEKMRQSLGTCAYTPTLMQFLHVLSLTLSLAKRPQKRTGRIAAYHRTHLFAIFIGNFQLILNNPIKAATERHQVPYTVHERVAGSGGIEDTISESSLPVSVS
jgi:hypothetical protein